MVKVGTGVLTDSRKQIDPGQLEQIVAQVVALRQAGKEVVVVTSGAVGAGMGALGFDSRPTNLAEKQACAAVGQSRLMSTYEKLFAKHNLVVAQVLLTHDDLEHHERHLNARNTLVTLLGRGVVHPGYSSALRHEAPASFAPRAHASAGGRTKSATPPAIPASWLYATSGR